MTMQYLNGGSHLTVDCVYQGHTLDLPMCKLHTASGCCAHSSVQLCWSSVSAHAGVFVHIASNLEPSPASTHPIHKGLYRCTVWETGIMQYPVTCLL